MPSILLLLTLVYGSPAPAGEPSGSLLETVKDLLSPRPQWADMAFAILEDRAMDPRGGWWPSGGTRFDWGWARRSFDRDRDGSIGPAEIPVAAERFARLDRDADGALTGRDFEPPRDLGGQSGGLFRRLDHDSNGRVSKAEFDEFFRDADAEELGFLSQEDFATALAGPRRDVSRGSQAPREKPAKARDDGGPNRWALLWMLFSRQLGSLEEGPAVGDPAPDFLLRERGSLLGTPLRDALGKKPVVLVFGSFT